MFDHVPNRKEIARRIENCRLNGGEVLDLSNLYMMELPAELEGFKNLAELNVSYNQLESLPDWIGKLTSLKKLNLRGNSINSLPDSVGGEPIRYLV